MMKPRTTICLAALAAFAIMPAHGALMVTNGDFETGAPGAGGNAEDVAGWFDGATHPVGFWQDIWHSNNNQPAGQSGAGVGLSGVNNQGFLYQDIGTNDGGATQLDWSISLGAFTDAGTAVREGTLTVGIYEVTGAYAGGADGTDVDGAVGVTLVGSDSVAISRTGGNAAIVEAGSIDISGVNASNNLILRIYWVGGGPNDANGFMSGDDVTISAVPEPGSLALLGLGGLCVLRRRRG